MVDQACTMLWVNPSPISVQTSYLNGPEQTPTETRVLHQFKIEADFADRRSDSEAAGSERATPIFAPPKLQSGAIKRRKSGGSPLKLPL